MADFARIDNPPDEIGVPDKYLAVAA